MSEKLRQMSMDFIQKSKGERYAVKRTGLSKQTGMAE